MVYGLVFWAILITAIQFLNCKRKLSELWWGLEIVMKRIFQKIKTTATTVSIYILSLIICD
jgi:hypothetical protein